MKKTTSADLHELPEPGPEMAPHFTGPVGILPLHKVDEAHRLNVAVVRFENGTRNHWHHHAGGQVLHVIEGRGHVQSRGEPRVDLEVGDSVAAEPGEEHWHGARDGESMTHIAVNVGETTWLEPVAE
jgi:quercetin dioxygenase-like cupin family protein